MIFLYVILIVSFAIYLKYFFNGHWNALYFSFKKKQANERWKLTNKQQYIIPLKNRLKVISSDEIGVYNIIARKYRVPLLTILTIDKIAYYKTPAGNFIEFNRKIKVSDNKKDKK
jgi:hypothetical protein